MESCSLTRRAHHLSASHRHLQDSDERLIRDSAVTKSGSAAGDTHLVLRRGVRPVGTLAEYHLDPNGFLRCGEEVHPAILKMLDVLGHGGFVIGGNAYVA